MAQPAQQGFDVGIDVFLLRMGNQNHAVFSF